VIKNDVVKSIMAVKIRTADELDAASESINDDMSQVKDVQYQHADIATDSAETEKPADVAVAPVRSGPKVGRNDPCPCGSGKKYKACCGALS
jgi:preprotein translocase subunit SecA